MASEAEMDNAIEDIEDYVTDIVDDTELWSQAESAEIYEYLSGVFKDRAQMIRSEMED